MKRCLSQGTSKWEIPLKRVEAFNTAEVVQIPLHVKHFVCSRWQILYDTPSCKKVKHQVF